MYSFRVMTLNLGGGVKNYTGSSDISAEKSALINQLINQIKPDFLGVQEIAQYTDEDGHLHSMVNQIQQGGHFAYSFYGETLSMKRHMQIKKDLMINAIFNDWWDWSKGNAIFSRWPFCRLSDERYEGHPRNLPLFQPQTYEGTRDTDPRFVILSRLQTPPFPYVMNLHLSTLVGERGKIVWQDSVDAARITRTQQLQKVIGLVETHVLQKGLPLILLGDFNALPEEYSLAKLLVEETGFVRLVPINDISSHTSAGMVDHIFVSPGSRLKAYTCEVINSDLAHAVSDHLTVVANIELE